MTSAQTALPSLDALLLLLRYAPLICGVAALLSALGWGWQTWLGRRGVPLWRCLAVERGLILWGVGLILAGTALVASVAALRWASGLALGGFVAWCALTRGGGDIWPSSSELPGASGLAGQLAGLRMLPGWVFPLLWATAAVPLWFPEARPQATVLALALLAASLLLPVFWGWRPWPPAPDLPAMSFLLLTAIISAWRSDASALTLPKVTGLVLGLYGYWALWRWRAAGGSSVRVALWCGALTLGFTLVGLAGGLRPTKVGLLGEVLARMPRLLRSLPGTQHGRVSMNQLGGAIVHVAPVLMALVTCRPGRRSVGGRLPWALWLASLIGSLLLLGALLLTQSRAAWGGMLVAALVLLAGRVRWGLWALLGILLVGLVLWVIWGRTVIAPQVVQALVGPLPTSWGTVTLQGRLSIWNAAAGYVMREPWLGQGLGTFRLEGVEDLAGRSVFDVGMPHAHNVLLGVAYDVGLPGLAAYLSLLLTWLMAGWRALGRASGPARQVALGALAGLVGAHAYGMVDAVALGAKPGVLFWMLPALIGTAILPERVNRRQPR